MMREKSDAKERIERLVQASSILAFNYGSLMNESLLHLMDAMLTHLPSISFYFFPREKKLVTQYIDQLELFATNQSQPKPSAVRSP